MLESGGHSPWTKEHPTYPHCSAAAPGPGTSSGPLLPALLGASALLLSGLPFRVCAGGEHFLRASQHPSEQSILPRLLPASQMRPRGGAVGCPHAVSQLVGPGGPTPSLAPHPASTSHWEDERWQGKVVAGEESGEVLGPGGIFSGPSWEAGGCHGTPGLP